MERVIAAFDDVVAEQGGGAGLAVFLDGECVLDRCGGTVAASSLIHTWSAIKPVSATCLLLTLRRHGLPLATPVSAVWPALRAAAGGSLTLADVLAHRAGLATVPFDGDVTRLVGAVATEAAIEAQPPDWTPGTAAGEHALTFGALVGGLVRRIDGRSLGSVLRSEVAEPFGLDLHVGLGPGELARAVDLEMPPGWWDGLGAVFTGSITPASVLGRGITAEVVNGDPWRRAEIAAVNGHATAVGLAGFWARVLDRTLPGEVMKPFGVEAEVDRVLGWPVRWTLGSAQHDGDEIGMGGVGGSYAGIRPSVGLAWAFLTTVMGSHDRATRIEAAILESLLGRS